MALSDLVSAGRAAAAELQRDACVITRGTDAPPVYDAATDSYASPSGVVLYTGPCRVKSRGYAEREVEAGEESVSLFAYIVSVPITATAYDVGDSVLITASQLDPALAGLRLRVGSPSLGSQMTARRLGCEVQT